MNIFRNVLNPMTLPILIISRFSMIYKNTQ
jgi:hypothetical protein